jgi:hypothetical protein
MTDKPVTTPAEPIDTEAFPLASGQAMDVPRPWWLTEAPLPKPNKWANWPKGAKSPSWFKGFALCPRRHSQKYRHKREDPQGLDAIIGNLIHGALEDGGRRRLHPGRRSPPPRAISREELLHLLEFQPEAVKGVGTEALARAREIISQIESVDMGNVWSVEHVWNFRIHGSLVAAGKADLVQIVPHYRNPNGPPERVVISDYKTGPGTMPSRRQLELDAQVALELAWGRLCWPQSRVQFRLWNLTQGREVYVDWRQDIHDLATSFARSCFNLWIQRHEEPNPGKHCTYCPFRSDCKAYEDFMRKASLLPPESLENKSVTDLARIFFNAKLVEKLAEQRRKDAGKLLMDKLARDQKSHEAGRWLIKKRSRRLDSFRSDHDTITKLSEVTGIAIPQLIDTCCKISKGQLDSFVKSLPPEKRKTAEVLIDHQKVLGHTPPWIEVREREAPF